MRRWFTLALLAALAAASPGLAKPKRTAPRPAPAPVAAPQVSVSRVPDGWRADLAFEGPLRGWALPRDHSGRRALYLLVGLRREPSSGETAPCDVGDPSAEGRDLARLYRWQKERPDRVELLSSALPEGSLDAADLDDDGEDELVLTRAGRIDVVTISPGGDVATRPYLQDVAIGSTCCGPRATWDVGGAEDTALRVGALASFRTYRQGRDGAAAIASDLAIPTRAKAGTERVRVFSPVVRPIGRAASGRMLFATEPESLGVHRLRTFLLDPDGPAEPRVVESWGLFPGAERLVDREFLILDGAPVLVVTTTSAEKLSLLANKGLRIYRFSGDRTRSGNDPMFVATTDINLWQQAFPAAVDLDGDGRSDLVLPYWKGLKNSIASLEVYRGAESGGFAKARSMSFDVDGGDKGFMAFGADVDGDGRPDLVLLANKELLVYPGTPPDRSAKNPVATDPSRRIPLPTDLPKAERDSVSFGLEGLEISRSDSGLGTPHLLDVDGDGRPEVLFVGNGEGGGRAIVVFVTGSSSRTGSSTLPAE